MAIPSGIVPANTSSSDSADNDNNINKSDQHQQQQQETTVVVNKDTAAVTSSVDKNNKNNALTSKNKINSKNSNNNNDGSSNTSCCDASLLSSSSDGSHSDTSTSSRSTNNSNNKNNGHTVNNKNSNNKNKTKNNNSNNKDSNLNDQQQNQQQQQQHQQSSTCSESKGSRRSSRRRRKGKHVTQQQQNDTFSPPPIVENNNKQQQQENQPTNMTTTTSATSSILRPRTPSPLSGKAPEYVPASFAATTDQTTTIRPPTAQIQQQSQPIPFQAPSPALSSSSESLEQHLREIGCMEQDDSARRRALSALETLLAQWADTFPLLQVQKPQSHPTAKIQPSQQDELDHSSSVAAENDKNNSTMETDHHYTMNETEATQEEKQIQEQIQQPQFISIKPRVSLVTFGSYRLGVHRPSSDLDCLAVAPPTITRHDFFTSLVALLKQTSAKVAAKEAMATPSADEEAISPIVSISEIHPIPSAYTPVIKFRLNGLQFDLLFARLADATKLVAFQQQQAELSASTTERLEYPIDDTDLLDQDEAGLRSLNGARVCQMLLETFQQPPSIDGARNTSTEEEQQQRLKTYRIVLCAVKHWAVVHGIYSNVLGFLGGINLAILVAWVCRKYPYSNDPLILLQCFFRTFAVWKWPVPVLLGPIQQTPPITEAANGNSVGSKKIPYVPAWNPATNPRDGLHIMPIITPAYPSMNSSYNVGIPQLRRMQDEFIRACQVLQETTTTTSNNSDARIPFQALLLQPNFFTRHEHFLQVTIRTTVVVAADAANNNNHSTTATATCTSKQDHVEWLRLVESRLRLLMNSLETPELHPWPLCRFFDQTYQQKIVLPTTTEEDGGEVTAATTTTEQQSAASAAVSTIYESHFFMALRFLPHLDKVDLRPLTSDFCHKVNSWDGRKQGMDLTLVHLLSAQLPEFCLTTSLSCLENEDEPETASVPDEHKDECEHEDTHETTAIEKNENNEEDQVADNEAIGEDDGDDEAPHPVAAILVQNQTQLPSEEMATTAATETKPKHRKYPRHRRKNRNQAATNNNNNNTSALPSTTMKAAMAVGCTTISQQHSSDESCGFSLSDGSTTSASSAAMNEKNRRPTRNNNNNSNNSKKGSAAASSSTSNSSKQHHPSPSKRSRVSKHPISAAVTTTSASTVQSSIPAAQQQQQTTSVVP